MAGWVAVGMMDGLRCDVEMDGTARWNKEGDWCEGCLGK